jgi:hypoxanthine phosphoribosyltransferase
MSQINERLQTSVNNFRDRVLTDPVAVLDPEGVVHHQFVSKNHGRKLDFDKIPTDSDFYIDWVSIYARVIRARYQDGLPDALVGIANGANRLSKSVSHLLGEKVLGLVTVKIDEKTVILDDEALEAIEAGKVKFALTIEDVGTTGGTIATAVDHLREAGVSHIEAITIWQRNPSLPRLDALEVPYSSVILEPLPMFSPEDCATEGFCAQGIFLIPHGK